jgi:ribosome-binding ATPase
MQMGIVGLPFSGKSTLFQTITNVYLDPNSTSKKDNNQAIVKVPDKRLDELTAIFNPKKKANATIEFVDQVGLQKGDNGSAQFTSNFLAKVKTNDALVHVVRGFHDELVPHSEGSIDLFRDIYTLDSEFILSDMSQIETRMEKLQKAVLKLNDDAAKKELAILTVWLESLHNEIPLRNLELNTPEEKLLLKNYQPLTAKPLLIVLNLDEADVQSSEQTIKEIAGKIKWKNTAVTVFFGKIELELSQLSAEEVETFMLDYKISESALTRIIRSSYDLLGLQPFFTVGEDECRAWTIKKGMTAQEAAGVIHSDFYKTFIRAEVVGYIDFMENGSFPKCKEKGLWRLEGKEYIVQDGDILSIRHN